MRKLSNDKEVLEKLENEIEDIDKSIEDIAKSRAKQLEEYNLDFLYKKY